MANLGNTIIRGNLTINGTLNGYEISNSPITSSVETIPTAQAIKSYVDSRLTAGTLSVNGSYVSVNTAGWLTAGTSKSVGGCTWGTTYVSTTDTGYKVVTAAGWATADRYVKSGAFTSTATAAANAAATASATAGVTASNITWTATSAAGKSTYYITFTGTGNGDASARGSASASASVTTAGWIPTGGSTSTKDTGNKTSTATSTATVKAWLQDATVNTTTYLTADSTGDAITGIGWVGSKYKVKTATVNTTTYLTADSTGDAITSIGWVGSKYKVKTGGVTQNTTTNTITKTAGWITAGTDTITTIGVPTGNTLTVNTTGTTNISGSGNANMNNATANKIYASGTTEPSNNKVISGFTVYGAVWNDYAECRKLMDKIKKQLVTDTEELSSYIGRCLCENGDDTISISEKRLQPGGYIYSDTFGMVIGETNDSKCPVAIAGRVLAYPYEGREEFRKHIGEPVCAGPDGTVSIMKRREILKYPERIIGTISAVPDYETWGTGNVQINGRVWIKI